MRNRLAARPLAARLLAVAAGLMTALAGGCAAIPSSGSAQSTSTPPAIGSGGGQCCEPIVRGPQPGWTPEQVVSGFLLASAFFAHHNAIAREYLTPHASKLWQPHSPVTILAQTPKVSPLARQLAGAEGGTMVEVTGHELATLNRNGQYIPAPQGGAAEEGFLLQTVNGRLLIAGLPPASSPGRVSHELLLSDYLFQLAYAPRNLYYYGLNNDSLVPDPVFVPAESSDVASTLVNDLLHSPNGWLRNTVRTAFPPHASLRRLQVLPSSSGGKIAIVDIGLPRDTSQAAVRAMATQLVTTLTSPSYGSALFQAVELKVNGHFWPTRSHPAQALGSYGHYVPHWRSNAAVFYLTSDGRARMLTRLAARSVAVPGRAGSGQQPLGQIAVSPDGKHLAGIADPATTIYVSELGTASKSSSHPSARLRARLTGHSFTGLSWDGLNDLWVAGRRGHSAGVWVLPAGQSSALRVRLPARVGPVTGLRVAPDGVRIAMIAGWGKAAHLLLGAVVKAGTRLVIPHTLQLGPHLTGVSALTWYDEDHLLVVTRTSSGARLWEVPANGNGAASLGRQPGMVSVTSAGPKNPLYGSLTSGRVEKSVGLAEPWTDVTAGTATVYPG